MNINLWAVFILSSFAISCSTYIKGKYRSNKVNQQSARGDFPSYEYAPEHAIPSQVSLVTSEDGAGLPDGRIVVAHNEDGLHAIAEDGTSMPFGNMKNVPSKKHTPVT